MDRLYDRQSYVQFDKGEIIGSARHEMYIIAGGAVEVKEVIEGESMQEAVTANVLHRGNTIGSLTDPSHKRNASFVAASSPEDVGASAAIVALLL
eukprot:SAG31_NODE_2053_length_6551_cov_7.496125_6_plen_95_part_00